MGSCEVGLVLSAMLKANKTVDGERGTLDFAQSALPQYFALRAR